MTDVQVSNARRIGFTALAVVTFWVLAWQAYWMPSAAMRSSSEFPLRSPIYLEEVTCEYFILSHWFLVVGPSLALVPLVFLSLSLHNSPVKVGDRWIWILGVVLAISIGFCHWLGEHDAMVSVRSYAPEVFWIGNGRVFANLENTEMHTLVVQEITSRWLLLPIILTTAFVIFGAWRRAVRDAEVEEEDEGE